MNLAAQRNPAGNEVGQPLEGWLTTPDPDVEPQGVFVIDGSVMSPRWWRILVAALHRHCFVDPDAVDDWASGEEFLGVVHAVGLDDAVAGCGAGAGCQVCAGSFSCD